MARVQLALNVSNIDDAVAFYSAMFGTEPHKRRTGYANFEVVDPPLKLVLFEVDERGQGEGNALNHIGIEVGAPQEVAQRGAAMSSSGLDVRREDSVVCCHAEQDKVYVLDPDGLEWETYAVTNDDPDALTLAVNDEETCCA